MSKTTAVLFTDRGKVEFGEVETPPPGDDDIVLRVRYSWISNGTEGSFLRGERADGVTPWDPSKPLPFPMVPGYQRVGVVEEVGKNVRSLAVGDWAFATITPTLNTHLGFGGHLARGPVAESEAYKLPQGADVVAFSGMVLTQVGFNTGCRPSVEEEAPVLVVGDGMVGHWAAQTIQHRGGRVAFLGKHPGRMGRFTARPQDLLLSFGEETWLERALDWAGGEFSGVVDTVGYDVNHALNDQLVPLLKWGGDFVEAGHAGEHGSIALAPFIRREATIHLPCGWTRARLEQTLELVHQGALKTTHLITHRLPAERAAQAWDMILNKKENALGVVLEWPEN